MIISGENSLWYSVKEKENSDKYEDKKFVFNFLSYLL